MKIKYLREVVHESRTKVKSSLSRPRPPSYHAKFMKKIFRKKKLYGPCRKPLLLHLRHFSFRMIPATFRRKLKLIFLHCLLPHLEGIELSAEEFVSRKMFKWKFSCRVHIKCSLMNVVWKRGKKKNWRGAELFFSSRWCVCI